MKDLMFPHALRSFLLAVMALALAGPAWAQVIEHKLTASDGAVSDNFGYSVSLSGERALVGSHRSDPLGTLSGSAYMYERQGDGSWLEVDKLTASDGAEEDFFGYSVSLSGDRALVAAYRDDDVGSGSGSAYAFERQGDGSWLEVDKLTASDGSGGDEFGWSVSLSGDRALVSAHQHDDLGSNSGSAYVYDNIFPTAVEMAVDLPQGYLLSAPYPNPFNPQAQFSLEVAQAQQVRIEVYNTLGRPIDVLLDELLPGRGTRTFTFDAGSLPSGVYLLRVTGETFAATRTMTLLK